MTNAPEKLWVDLTGFDDLDMYIAHDSNTMDYLNMDVSYTRTDISQARIAELEQALGRIAKARTYDDIYNQTEVWELEEIANAALKANEVRCTMIEWSAHGIKHVKYYRRITNATIIAIPYATLGQCPSGY
jgi:hypothetical protein